MIKKLLDFFYPRRCLLCKSPCSHDGLDLCDSCHRDLSLIDNSCFQCGIPLETSKPQQRCGQCLKKPPVFQQTIAIYHYQPPLSWLVQQMKFNKKQSVSHLLAQIMARQLEEKITERPDAILPVPLHYQRQFARGFNQAEELAKVIAGQLGCKLDRQYIERYQPGLQQSGLDARQRKKNVKNVFRVNNKQQNYQHVAVVDDVMSTGATVNEIARLLKKSGVKKVDVWVLARAEKL